MHQLTLPIPALIVQNSALPAQTNHCTLNYSHVQLLIAYSRDYITRSEIKF